MQGQKKDSWKPWLWSPDRWIALSAFVVSLSALGLTMYQGYADRLYKRLSVQPHLFVSFDIDLGGSAGWTLGNTGLGPAEIRWFSVTVDGRPQRTWQDVLTAVGLSAGVLTWQQVLYPGEFKAAHEPPTKLLRVSAGPASEALRKASDRVILEVCYCSLYAECWKRSDVVESRRSDSCDRRPSVIFRASLSR